MPGITKCPGDDCPYKMECVRFLTPADPIWQSWYMDVPYNEETQECTEFWNAYNKKEMS